MKSEPLSESKCKVLVTAGISDEGLSYLSGCGYEVLNQEGKRLDRVERYISGCDAVLTRTEKIDGKVLQAGDRLKVVAKHGVGVDCIDVKTATQLGIQVVNAPESNTISVAEHTLCLIVGLAKNLIRCHKAIGKGNYNDRETIRCIELNGKVLGIIGFGKIGKLTARKAMHGLGMNVIVYDPIIGIEDVPSEIEIANNLLLLLEKSDFVSLHIPHNEKTDKMIGLTEFRKMKRSAFFINAARGPVVHEEELIYALKTGLIAGAGLDVFETEPPDSANELLHLDNVILTPHNAALTEEAKQRMALHAAMGIHEVLSGKKPTWPVNNVRLRTSIYLDKLE